MAEQAETSVSSAEKLTNKRGHVINNVINTTRLITTFSIPPSEVYFWLDFVKLAKVEAGSRSRSQVILNALHEYYNRHREGNPQLKITTYMDSRAPSPMRVLCWNHLAGATNEGQVYCRKHGGNWIQGLKCYSCPDNQLRKKAVRNSH